MSEPRELDAAVVDGRQYVAQAQMAATCLRLRDDQLAHGFEARVPLRRRRSSSLAVAAETTVAGGGSDAPGSSVGKTHQAQVGTLWRCWQSSARMAGQWPF